MKLALCELIEELDSRALSPRDEKLMLDYADSMEARLKCMAEVQEHSKAAATTAAKIARKKYPDAETKHGLCWAKAVRDMELVVCECANGVLVDDIDFVDERILIWLHTILKSFDFEQNLIPDCFRFLKDEFEKLLSEQSFAYMAPMLDRTIARLGGEFDNN